MFSLQMIYIACILKKKLTNKFKQNLVYDANKIIRKFQKYFFQTDSLNVDSIHTVFHLT